MSYLLDTNILVRLADISDPLRPVASRAIWTLRTRGEKLHLAPQNFVEFRNVATRPTTVNGLGLSIAETEALAAGYEASFLMLPDTPDIHPAWRRIVEPLGVIGKQVHDARLLAVCHAHGVSHLLTFNVPHFARLVTAGPPVVVVDPAAV